MVWALGIVYYEDGGLGTRHRYYEDGGLGTRHSVLGGWWSGH